MNKNPISVNSPIFLVEINQASKANMTANKIDGTRFNKSTDPSTIASKNVEIPSNNGAKISVNH